MFAHQETDALGQQQRGVDERSHAQLFQLIRRHSQGFHQSGVNHPIVRIDPEQLDPVRHGQRYVFVEKIDGTGPCRDQQQGF